MALVKISALPPVGAAALTDILPEVQPPAGGTTFKVSLQQILTLFNLNIQIAESQVTNLTTDLANKVTRSGDTMTGFLILNADPVAALGAATKQYVDNAVSALNVIPAVYAASTVLIVSVTYANGAAGVGATLTNTGALVGFSIDSITPPLNSRILVKDQVTQLQNGIYTLTTQGGSGIPWVLTRATDYDQPSEIKAGDLVVVNNGTQNSGTGWIQRSTVATIGVDSITFSQFGGIIYPLALDKGGTNASLTASNGGIFYSTATAGAILSGTGTANQLLRSGSNSAPAWTTATYPLTTSINQLLYSSSANVITGLASAASSVMVTNGSSIPAFSTTLPSGLTILQPKIDAIFDTVNNSKVLQFAAGASTGNFVVAVGQAAGGSPGFQFAGSDTDVSAVYVTQGIGNHIFFNHLGTPAVLMQITGPLSTVNSFIMTAAATAGTPSISTTGTDSTVNFSLKAKGGGFFLQDSSATVGANLLFFNAASTHYTNLKVATAQATDLTLTLPAVDGSANFVMKTDGSGNLAFSNAGTLITQPTIQTFSSGSGTYTTPANVRYIVIKCWGSGGGGGGCTSIAGQSSAGGGGGGGGYVEHIINSPAASYSYAVGAGGAGGAIGTNPGITGGATTFSTLSAGGGGGGGGGASTTGGVTGGQGGGGASSGGNIVNLLGGLGSLGTVQATNISFGGQGGTGAQGSSGASIRATTNSGNAASSVGGGGGGGCTIGAGSVLGGAGFAGLIVVEEHYG